eukprot:8389863-Pyramimonas_sp.AAC.1
MHRPTKLQKKWQPTVVQVSPGAFSADPVRLREDETLKLGGFRKAALGPPGAWISDGQCFESATPEQIRTASKSFSKRTVQSLDSLHVRHFGLLSDAALEVMALLFEATDRPGLFPSQL